MDALTKTMTNQSIIDDPLIQQIRALKHRLASECDFDVHQMAEAIRKKGPELIAQLGLQIRPAEVETALENVRP